MNRPFLFSGLLILALPARPALSFQEEARQVEMRLVLQVHAEEALRAETELRIERLRQRAEEAKIRGLTFPRAGEASFQVSGLSPGQERQLSTFSANALGPGFRRRPGAGAPVFEMTPEAAQEIRRSVVRETVARLRNRLDQLGVDGPVREARGYRIEVRLPEVEGPDRIRDLLRTTGLLELRFVRFPEAGGVSSREAVLDHYRGELPPHLEILEGYVPSQGRKGIGKLYYAVETRRAITGRDIETARPDEGASGDPVVFFRLKPDAAGVFGKATEENIGSGLAIVLDGRVVSAPRITSRIGGGEGIIEGRFTREEAEDLAAVLRSGALPARVTVIQENIVEVSPPLSLKGPWLIGTAAAVFCLSIALFLSFLRGKAVSRKR